MAAYGEIPMAAVMRSGYAMSASTIRADPSEAAASDDAPILLLQTQQHDNPQGLRS
jgi:hypothetical protein